MKMLNKLMPGLYQFMKRLGGRLVTWHTQCYLSRAAISLTYRPGGRF